MTFAKRNSVAKPCAAVCIAVGLLAGCSDILFADFEADTVNQNPQSPIPGPPTGDAVGVEDGIDVGGSNDIYVTSAGALIESKSLRIDGPTGGITPVAVFVPKPRRDSSKPITVDYTGRFLADGTIRICMSGVNGFCSFLVRLMDGDVVIDDEVVGSYSPQGTHRMIFTLFPVLDSYSFTLLGDASVPDNLNGDLPFAGNIPNDLNLGVRLEDAGTSDSYLMDNVRIRVRN